MLEKYIFEVPLRLQPLVDAGVLQRVGAIIKDTSSGRIVAHMQQTGMGQQLVGSLIGSPFNVLNTASSLVANAQLAGLKRMVEGLQILQYANLGVGLVGMGVTVAGFAIVNKKLTRIEKTVEELSQTMDRNFAQLYLNQLYRDLNGIRGVLEGIEASKRLSDPKGVLINAASRLSELRSGVRGHIEYQLQQNTFDEQLFTQLTSALLLCDNARLESYILANEYDSAHFSATAVAGSYAELFDDVTPYDLGQKRRISHRQPGGNIAATPMGKPVGDQNIVTALRDITDAAATQPFLIEALDRKRISGPEYMASLRDESTEPLVLVRFDE
ncbi:hypothetical protein [Marinobacter sp. C2H3]|uniref:hypothetical protein n=1 Tax=Marinobacter sp. C2H3 TaxID=3119003 RepID=UPI00300F4AA4